MCGQHVRSLRRQQWRDIKHKPFPLYEATRLADIDQHHLIPDVNHQDHVLTCWRALGASLNTDGRVHTRIDTGFRTLLRLQMRLVGGLASGGKLSVSEEGADPC